MISEPKLEFDGYKLSITYDLVTRGQSDIFFIWVEIENQDGKPIRAYSFKGEVGDSVKPGTNKKIIWVPEADAVLLDEDITVELKGEKYERSFNKGSAMLMSTAVPGLGQTRIKNGKPWWLVSIPAYGALAGGLIVNKKYLDTYGAYKIETDPTERADLLNKASKQQNMSNALLISAATLWVGNLIWVAATPNHYRPLQHSRLSFNSIPSNQGRLSVLSFKIDF
jgi:hypothetical protein